MFEVFILPVGMYCVAAFAIAYWLSPETFAVGVITAEQSSDSRLRNRASYVAVFAITLSLVFLHIPYGQFSPSGSSIPIGIALFLLPTLAMGYFILVIVYVLFLSITETAFDADAIRLARDTGISILFNIAAAALLYKYFGLVGPNPPTTGVQQPFGNWAYLYFSAVTFSTLGYGDFSPLPNARAIAAIQAVIGNLHLGIIVGTVLVALKGRPGR